MAVFVGVTLASPWATGPAISHVLMCVCVCVCVCQCVFISGGKLSSAVSFLIAENPANEVAIETASLDTIPLSTSITDATYQLFTAQVLKKLQERVTSSFAEVRKLVISTTRDPPQDAEAVVLAVVSSVNALLQASKQPPISTEFVLGIVRLAVQCATARSRNGRVASADVRNMTSLMGSVRFMQKACLDALAPSAQDVEDLEAFMGNTKKYIDELKAGIEERSARAKASGRSGNLESEAETLLGVAEAELPDRQEKEAAWLAWVKQSAQALATLLEKFKAKNMKEKIDAENLGKSAPDTAVCPESGHARIELCLLTYALLTNTQRLRTMGLRATGRSKQVDEVKGLLVLADGKDVPEYLVAGATALTSDDPEAARGRQAEDVDEGELGEKMSGGASAPPNEKRKRTAAKSVAAPAKRKKVTGG